MLQNRADLLEPLTAHVTWIVLLAHSWSLHGLNKIVNRFLGASYLNNESFSKGRSSGLFLHARWS
ncbi:hypothetical protein BRL93_21075 [Xanthomonas oryzae pv. oryzae]|nr:hypothetical protein BRL93_21075 [Xanthomonas oryzae pv. oryzae]